MKKLLILALLSTPAYADTCYQYDNTIRCFDGNGNVTTVQKYYNQYQITRTPGMTQDTPGMNSSQIQWKGTDPNVINCAAGNCKNK